MSAIVVASGTGFSSLQGTASYIDSVIAKEPSGKEIELKATVGGNAFAIRLHMAAFNQQLSGQGLKPWPGYSSIAMQDSVNRNLIYCRWVNP